MIVAIHQPNYIPWLGYIAKIARADVFVFLDDVQFSKNSYTNRVQILGPNGARWLTIPVSVHLGQIIGQTEIAQHDWAARHLDTLRGLYRRASAFRTVWPIIERLYEDIPDGSLATVNRILVERMASLLGLQCQFIVSSEIATCGTNSDERLARIVREVAPGGIYLSGQGAATYQHSETFSAAGVSLEYMKFPHPRYDQGHEEFVNGLSTLDALFHCGVDAVKGFLREART